MYSEQVLFVYGETFAYVIRNINDCMTLNRFPIKRKEKNTTPVKRVQN